MNTSRDVNALVCVVVFFLLFNGVKYFHFVFITFFSLCD